MLMSRNVQYKKNNYYIYDFLKNKSTHGSELLPSENKNTKTKKTKHNMICVSNCNNLFSINTTQAQHLNNSQLQNTQSARATLKLKKTI